MRAAVMTPGYGCVPVVGYCGPGSSIDVYRQDKLPFSELPAPGSPCIHVGGDESNDCGTHSLERRNMDRSRLRKPCRNSKSKRRSMMLPLAALVAATSRWSPAAAATPSAALF